MPLLNLFFLLHLWVAAAVCASYLHFITKAVKPLLFMPLMGVMNKLQSQMVQIHLMGR